jgi:hypothetical protein
LGFALTTDARAGDFKQAFRPAALEKFSSAPILRVGHQFSLVATGQTLGKVSGVICANP